MISAGTWKKEEWFNYLFEKTNQQFHSVEKAGEGNMNLTLRFKNAGNSLIAKHAPPYCEKFPHIPAPVERLKTEFTFYKTIIEENGPTQFIPKIFDFDEKNNILLMEDLGNCRDFSFLYSGESEIQSDVIEELSSFLNQLHGLNNLREVNILRNEPMKKLNHDYIFNLPYSDKSFDLKNLFPTTYKEVEKILSNPEIKKIALDFGKIYLTEGNTLLHGDFYPASWLQSKNKTSIIDPEFCLIGVPEFDLSVTVAHFILSMQPMEKISYFLDSYNHPFNKDYVNSFASLEIIRRLVYVAQLPLVMTEEEKFELLEKAVRVLKRETSWI